MRLRELKNKIGLMIDDIFEKKRVYVYHNFFKLPLSKKTKKKFLNDYVVFGHKDLKEPLYISEKQITSFEKQLRIVVYKSENLITTCHYAQKFFDDDLNQIQIKVLDLSSQHLMFYNVLSFLNNRI